MFSLAWTPEAIRRFLTEPEVRAVVLTLLRRPATGRHLAKATGIPIARCFRILRRLQRLHLVEAGSRAVDRRGHLVEVFRAHLERLHISLRDGRVRVRLLLPKAMVGPRAGP